MSAVPNAVEALEFFQTHAREIDVMITDLILPEMNGLELAERVRVLHPKLKVLFISGSDFKMSKSFRRLGIDSDFLAKPFTPLQLAERVEELRA